MKHTIINCSKNFFIILLITFLFNSCDKTEDIQEFDDVFDTSGINDLNSQIENATSLDDILVIFDESSDDEGLKSASGRYKYNIPSGMNDVSFDDIIDHYTKAINISSKERDLLLKNDSKTYLDVINRMGAFPDKIAKMNIDFSELRSSPWNKYLVSHKQEPRNFYSNDYYSAVLAMQNYISKHVINTMKTCRRHYYNKHHGGHYGGHWWDEDPEIMYYILITSNNNWDIWWTYWSDGSRTKHKGASGTYPG